MRCWKRFTPGCCHLMTSSAAWCRSGCAHGSIRRCSRRHGPKGGRCRLIALMGMGGVGKTALAATAVQAVAAHFEIVIWRSLLNAPPLDEILSAALYVVSGHSLPDVPASLDERLALLLDYLRRRR